MSVPVITTQPLSQTVVRTNTTSATFTVVATGTAPLSYQWQVNAGTGFIALPGATGASYTLLNIVKTQDQYQYRCVVTNFAGTTTSNTAILTVFNGPQLTPFSRTNASGQTSATLTCDYVTQAGEAVETAILVPAGRIAKTLTVAASPTSTTTTTTASPTSTTTTTTASPITTTTTIAPEPLPSSVDVNISRLSTGTEPTLVSSGFPLPAGLVTPQTIENFRLMVNDVEVPIYVEPLFGRHTDNSYRSVLIQFTMQLTTNQTVTGRIEFGPAGTRQGTRTAIAGNLESAVILPASPSYIISTGIVFRTLPSSQTAGTALGLAFDAEYLSAANLHPISPERENLVWELNFYDRVLSSYAQWARTGELRYWRDATLLSRQYVNWGMQANGGRNIAPLNFHSDGVFVSYLLTGNETARSLLPGFAVWPATSSFWVPNLNYNFTNFREGRDQVRIMLACLYSALLEDSSQNWFSLADAFVESWLDTQEPYWDSRGQPSAAGKDGAWLYPLNGPLYLPEQGNFNEGLRVTGLITYLELRNPSGEIRTRVEQAIKKQVDFLWNTQWLPQFLSFKYHSNQPPASDKRGDAVLNNLIVLGFAYVFHLTGDEVYRGRALQIMSQAFVPPPELGGVVWWAGGNGKFFNQQYYSSFRVFYYLNLPVV